MRFHLNLILCVLLLAVWNMGCGGNCKTPNPDYNPQDPSSQACLSEGTGAGAEATAGFTSSDELERIEWSEQDLNTSYTNLHKSFEDEAIARITDYPRRLFLCEDGSVSVPGEGILDCGSNLYEFDEGYFANNAASFSDMCENYGMQGTFGPICDNTGVQYTLDGEVIGSAYLEHDAEISFTSWVKSFGAGLFSADIPSEYDVDPQFQYFAIFRAEDLSGLSVGDRVAPFYTTPKWPRNALEGSPMVLNEKYMLYTEFVCIEDCEADDVVSGPSIARLHLTQFGIGDLILDPGVQIRNCGRQGGETILAQSESHVLLQCELGVNTENPGSGDSHTDTERGEGYALLLIDMQAGDVRVLAEHPATPNSGEHWDGYHSGIYNYATPATHHPHHGGTLSSDVNDPAVAYTELTHEGGENATWRVKVYKNGEITTVYEEQGQPFSDDDDEYPRKVQDLAFQDINGERTLVFAANDDEGQLLLHRARMGEGAQPVAILRNSLYSFNETFRFYAPAWMLYTHYDFSTIERASIPTLTGIEQSIPPLATTSVSGGSASTSTGPSGNEGNSTSSPGGNIPGEGGGEPGNNGNGNIPGEGGGEPENNEDDENANFNEEEDLPENNDETWWGDEEGEEEAEEEEEEFPEGWEVEEEEEAEEEVEEAPEDENDEYDDEGGDSMEGDTEGEETGEVQEEVPEDGADSMCCSGFCGEQSGICDCYCDTACVSEGDCCDDACEVCGTCDPTD